MNLEIRALHYAIANNAGRMLNATDYQTKAGLG